MPWALKEPCKAVGCSALVTKGQRYCTKHQGDSRYQTKKDNKTWKQKELSSNPLAREHRAFYKSKAWRNLRQIHLHQEPLCRNCQRPGTVVDHIVPIMRGGEMLDQNNLQTLCESCHNSKRARERLKKT